MLIVARIGVAGTVEAMVALEPRAPLADAIDDTGVRREEEGVERKDDDNEPADETMPADDELFR